MSIYSNILPKPTVSYFPTKNRVRLRWSAVEPIPTPEYPSASVERYRVYEGGNLGWSCPNCSSSVYQENKPSVCPQCGYIGTDWDWHITSTITGSVVYSTEYTALGVIKSGNVFRVVAEGEVEDSESMVHPATSEPTTLSATVTGSVVPSGASDLSLISMSNLVQEDIEYLNISGSVSLNNTVYNPNHNPFSEKLPGDFYVQNSYMYEVRSGQDLYTRILKDNTKAWFIRSGSAGGSVTASLLSFRDYCTAYEYAYTGSRFYFPWGYLNFDAAGNLHRYRGIVDTQNLSGSFSMTLFGTIAGDLGYVNQSEVDSKATRLVGTYYTTGSVVLDYSNLAGRTYAFPGLVLYRPDAAQDILIYKGARSFADVNLGNSQEVTVEYNIQVPVSTLGTFNHNSRLYPVVLVSPDVTKIPARQWTAVSHDSGDRLADQIFTVDDCYLPISVQ